MTVIKLLGTPQTKNEATWLDLPQAKPLFLMAYLVSKTTWVSRDSLRYLFWPDAPDNKSLQNLRGLVFRCKQLPFGDQLEIEKTRLRWQLSSDIEAFRKAIDAKDWKKAVAHYSGPFLGDAVSDDIDYNEWLIAERRVLQSNYQSAVIQHATELEQQQEHEAASSLLEKIVLTGQLAEDILQQYLRNTYLAGKSSQALTIYDNFKERLQHELNLEPLEATEALVKTIQDAGKITENINSSMSLENQQSIPINLLKPPKVIGRDQQIAEIQMATETVILLAGEAGAGKSRLMASLAPNTFKLSCQEGLEKVPYYPITNTIRAELSNSPLPDTLGQYKEDLARLVPEVAPELTPSPVDAEVGRVRLFEAISLYFESICDRNNSNRTDSNFHLVIDDLQWADEATLEFLLYLAGRKQLRFLAAYRVHEASEILLKTIASLTAAKLGRVVRLEPLSYEDVITFVASLTGSEQGPPLFSQWLYNMTTGNPMFMLETLKSLFEADKLRTEDETWVTDVDASTEDYSELGIPEAVSEIIQRRIERLSDNTKRIITIAAVVNRNFSPELLSHISGLSEFAVLNSLEEAENLGLIQDSSFSHDLFRQSIYENLLSKNRKKSLHGQVAGISDSIYTMEAALRAEHWFLAQQNTKAATAWLEAGQQLLERGLLEEAIEVFELAKQHSEGTVIFEEAILLLCETTFQQANYSLASTYCDSILNSSQEHIKAATFDLKARLLLKGGQLEAAEDYSTQGLEIANQIDNPKLRSKLIITHYYIISELGHAEAAIAMVTPELEILRKQGKSLGLARALTNLAANHNHIGEYEYALKLHLEALEIARHFGAKHVEVDVAQNLVYCYIELGEMEKGITIGEEALKLGNFEMTDGLMANLAAAYIKLERYPEAIKHYEAMTLSADQNVRMVAWGRLAGLYHWSKRPEEDVQKAVEEAFGLYEGIELQSARARAVVSALNYGNAAQLEQVKSYLQEVQNYTLPPYLREELNDALAKDRMNNLAKSENTT